MSQVETIAAMFLISTGLIAISIAIGIGVGALVKAALREIHNWRIRRLFKPFRVGTKVKREYGGELIKGIVVEHMGEYLRIQFASSWVGYDYIRYDDLHTLKLEKLSPFEQRVQDYIYKELAH